LALVPLLSAGTARAQVATQQGLVVEAQSARPQFPDMVDFALRAHGFTTFRAELNYRLVGEPYTAGIEAQVAAPATNLDLQVTLDLSTHYIPPGAEVSYHWKLTGENADVETPEKTFTMTDSRYHWNSVTDAARRVTVHWYKGDKTFGGAVRDTASNALDRLERDIGVGLERPANVWVYTTQDDLLGALPQNMPEWVGGRAFPELSLVLAAISDDQDTDTEIKRVVPHELSHLLLYQATRNPYNVPPAWLDEGLAVHNQEWQDPTEEEALKQAAENGTLRPLKALTGSFGAYEDDAILAYAESRSVVDFLLSDDRYGPSKFAKSISAFRAGVTFDEALKTGLGATTDEIDAQWRASLPYTVAAPGSSASVGSAHTPSGRKSPIIDMTNPGPYVIVGLAIFAALFLSGAGVTLFALLKRGRKT
jgi:hypothetical protein